MAINITVTDAQNEKPQHLRGLAHYFNCLAADLEGKGGPYPMVAAAAPITQETLPANPGNDLAAPGASADSTPNAGSDANAQGGGSTDIVLDKAGLPWDERIHSSSKNLTAENLWRYKRITVAAEKPAFEELKAQVEAELRQRMAGQAVVITKVTAGVDTVTDLVNEQAPPPPPLNQIQGQPGAETPPPPPPLNQDAGAGDAEVPAIGFKEVFNHVNALQKHASGNLLPPELLTQVFELAGVVPATMAGFIKPENKAKAEAVLDAINALVEGA